MLFKITAKTHEGIKDFFIESDSFENATELFYDYANKSANAKIVSGHIDLLSIQKTDMILIK
jgi:hypothetical protein